MTAKKRVFKDYNLGPNTPSQRQTKAIPSLSTPGGDTALKPSQQYTGNKMIGISIIHKSCLQPVFSEEEAKEVASMRR